MTFFSTWEIERVQLPFVKMGKTLGGRSSGENVRSLVLDMRCLSANQDVSSRRLDVTESEIDGKGLG